VEHRGPKLGVGDPDLQSDVPTAYTALRTTDPEAVYVEYADGELEYYDIASDPFELRNIAHRLPAARLNALHARLTGLRNCHDAAACWNAAAPKPSRNR
jgi:hypothetical protein